MYKSRYVSATLTKDKKYVVLRYTPREPVMEDTRTDARDRKNDTSNYSDELSRGDGN